MNSRTNSRIISDRAGRAGRGACRVLAGAGAAIALAAAAPIVWAQPDKPDHRHGTVQRSSAAATTATTRYYTDDPAWRDGARAGDREGRGSYGQVNYPEDRDYGDFAYYSDYPPGRYDHLRTRETTDRSTTRAVQYREPYTADYDNRVHRAGMYEQSMVRGGRDLPQTSVTIHQMSLAPDQQMSRPSTVQTARFDDRQQQRTIRTDIREDVVYQPAVDPALDPQRRRWLSYGDVNYEADQGYGEFSYYGEEPGEVRRSGESRLYDSRPARYQPAGAPGSYYTEDSDRGRSDFDRWYDRNR